MTATHPTSPSAQCRGFGALLGAFLDALGGTEASGQRDTL